MSGSKPAPPAWSCHRCGDCCTRPVALVVTDQELEEMQLETGYRYPLTLAQGPHGFVAIKAGPCPFRFADKGGSVGCAVYPVRPYNCRRYMCGRATCADPWDDKAVPTVVLESKPLRLHYRKQQRVAMGRAIHRGWAHLGDE